MRFINRENELKFLNEKYDSKNPELVVIYGRRRTGKTTLIEEFIKGKPSSIYYLADLQTQGEQIDDLRVILVNYFSDKVLASLAMNKWDQIFTYLTEKLNSTKEKVVFVIDEYTYLHQSNKAIASIIQKYWDKYWSKNNNLLLILCGSFLGMMERSVLYYTSPLYGRVSGQIKLTPFGFKDFIKFFPVLPLEKQVEFYTVAGGTPRYILECNPNKTIFENIKENFFNPKGFIYNDPTSLLSQELTKTNTYFSILKTIAEGSHKIGHVASKLEIKTNQLNTYLDKLIELGIVKREIPITEAVPHKSKKGLYFIQDNLFRFWFKFILPNKSYLEVGQSQRALEQVKRELPLLISIVFENICQELIARPGNYPFSITRWGKWWDRAEEIDIVGVNDKTGEIIFSECKWQNRPVEFKILKDLERKSRLVHWQKKKKDFFVLFSKKGFEPKLVDYAKERKNVILLKLDDLV